MYGFLWVHAQHRRKTCIHSLLSKVPCIDKLGYMKWDEIALVLGYLAICLCFAKTASPIGCIFGVQKGGSCVTAS